MLAIYPKNRMNLVSVMSRLLHGDQGLRLAVRLHLPPEAGGLCLQLFLVANVDPSTAAAFCRDRTELMLLLLGPLSLLRPSGTSPSDPFPCLRAAASSRLLVFFGAAAPFGLLVCFGAAAPFPLLVCSLGTAPFPLLVCFGAVSSPCFFFHPSEISLFSFSLLSFCRIRLPEPRSTGRFPIFSGHRSSSHSSHFSY